MMKPLRCFVISFVVLVTALAAAAATASSPTDVDTHQPFSATFFNPCLGETFFAQGFMHSKTHFSVSTSGVAHFSTEVNFQDMRGVALSSGARYVVQQNDVVHFNTASDATPENIHSVFREQYVRQGEDGTLIMDDDFIIYFRLNLVVNANGTTTVQNLDFDFDCR